MHFRKGLLAIFLFLSSFSNGQPAKVDSVYINLVFSNLKRAIDQKLTNAERRVINGALLEYDSNASYSNKMRVVPNGKNKCIIRISSGFIQKVSSIGLMLAIQNQVALTNRRGILEQYLIFYEPLGLHNYNCLEFAAIHPTKVRYVESQLINPEYDQFVKNSFTFCLLHELAHAILNCYNSTETRNCELEADNWTFQKIKDASTFYGGSDYLTRPENSTSIIQAFVTIGIQDDSRGINAKSKPSGELERMMQFEQFLKASYCPNEKYLDFCKRLDSTMKQTQAEISYFQAKARGMEKLKSGWAKKIDSIKQYVKTYFGNISVTLPRDSLFLKKEMFYREFSKLFLSLGLDPYNSIEFLPFLSSAFLKGSYGVNKNVDNALAISESVANIDRTTLFGAMYTAENSDFMWRMIEGSAVSAATIYQYHKKNHQKAIYYFTVAKAIARAFPVDFYENKINYIKVKKVL